MDITPAILANSSQLNNVDLLEDITVTVVNAFVADDKKVRIETDVFGASRPYIPNKEVLREIGKVWGKETAAWTGRRLVLYTLPTVKYAGEVKGGIRVRAMSHIDKPITYTPSQQDGLGRGGKLTIQPLPDAPTPTPDVSKVPAAVNAINNAATLDALVKVETYAVSLGINGHPDVTGALEVRKKELT